MGATITIASDLLFDIWATIGPLQAYLAHQMASQALHLLANILSTNSTIPSDALDYYKMIVTGIEKACIKEHVDMDATVDLLPVPWRFNPAF